MNWKTSLISNTVMEDDIQNYPSTVMFCGTPCIIHMVQVFFQCTKELSFCHKLWVSNFNIVATQCRRPLIFQTLKDIDIGFKKTEFVEKTQFLLRKTKMLTWNLQNKKSKEQENAFYVCIMAELCWADNDIHFVLKFDFLQFRDVEIFSYFCTWQLL